MNGALRDLSRREFLGRSGLALGSLALAELLGQEQAPLAGRTPLRARARRVIYLFQNGGPTHVELFDGKPELARRHGEPVPPSLVAGKRFSTMTGDPEGKLLLAPLEPFARHGQSGATLSSLLPHTAAIADRLCFVKSMHTDAINHAPAISLLLSGGQIPGRPTLGAWLHYGLGSENRNLPAFVVMTSATRDTTCGQIFYDFYWGSGFLPSRHQGVRFRGQSQPVLYLSPPPGLPPRLGRSLQRGLARMNRHRHAQRGDEEILSRTAQFEMAFRMQSSVPELADLSGEPEKVLAMYGPDVKRPGSYAHNCLMARRLAERGVRYIQLMHAGWDQHNSLTTELYSQCRDTDQPSAALVKDLEQRGLLEDTLVIWGGEFGRTPFLQGRMEDRERWGRDHHPYAFTVWLAGGGVRPGHTHGATDELSLEAVSDPVHVHDLQATILHLLGIDHERFTFRHQGRHFRLTDVHGRVVSPILA